MQFMVATGHLHENICEECCRAGPGLQSHQRFPALSSRQVLIENLLSLFV